MNERQFPILRSRIGDPREFVPWSFVEAHKQQIERNHYQSLELLAERGGLSWAELLSAIERQKLFSTPKDEARPRVLAHLEKADA